MRTGKPAKCGRLLAASCAALVAMLLAAGCGRAVSKAGYEREMVAVGRQADEAIRAMQPEGQVPPTPGDLREVASDLRDAAGEAEAVAAPGEVRVHHGELVAGLRELGTAVDALASDLEDADGDRQALEAWSGFATSDPAEAAFDSLEESRDGFEREGYRVFGDPTG